MQMQCPWCGRVGDRDHVPEHECVCRHVNTKDRTQALLNGGRYWDEEASQWCCPWCEDWATAQEEASKLAEEQEASDQSQHLTAELIDGEWTVIDPMLWWLINGEWILVDGVRWWPNADAAEEIAQSSRPAEMAVHICATKPQCGEWGDL